MVMILENIFDAHITNARTKTHSYIYTQYTIYPQLDHEYDRYFIEMRKF